MCKPVAAIDVPTRVKKSPQKTARFAIDGGIATF
jgi:hypothetical protein